MLPLPLSDWNGTRTFVVKTRSLEETNHVAGVCHGGGIVTAVKAQGSQLCHFLSLAVGERRGRVFVRLPPCEGEKPPPGFSLVQHVLLERATCFKKKTTTFDSIKDWNVLVKASEGGLTHRNSRWVIQILAGVTDSLIHLFFPNCLFSVEQFTLEIFFV